MVEFPDSEQPAPSGQRLPGLRLASEPGPLTVRPDSSIEGRGAFPAGRRCFGPCGFSFRSERPKIQWQGLSASGRSVRLVTDILLEARDTHENTSLLGRIALGFGRFSEDPQPVKYPTSSRGRRKPDASSVILCSPREAGRVETLRRAIRPGPRKL